MDEQFMIDLVRAKMPFGKYKDYYITDIPVHYLEWMNREGFESNKLGQYLSTMFEIRTNGLIHILRPIIAKYR